MQYLCVPLYSMFVLWLAMCFASVQVWVERKRGWGARFSSLARAHIASMP